MNHLKQRRKLLEEELRRSGGLVDASGRPAGSAVPLVDANGRPLQGKGESMKGKGESMKGKGESMKGKGESMKGKGESTKGKGEPVHITEDIDAVVRARNGKQAMKSASAPMLNVYDAKEGDTIEVCPEACMLVQEIVMWLEETKGRLQRGFAA